MFLFNGTKIIPFLKLPNNYSSFFQESIIKTLKSAISNAIGEKTITHPQTKLGVESSLYDGKCLYQLRL
jgi:hypothetical protein